jgi:hypothetical protein
VRRGGVLAVVIADPYRDGVPVEVGPLVSAAHAARLSYLQHIVAVHAHVDGDQITSPNPGRTALVSLEVLARLGDSAHVRVHTDLLVFTPGAIPASSEKLTDSQPEPEGPQRSARRGGAGGSR